MQNRFSFTINRLLVGGLLCCSAIASANIINVTAGNASALRSAVSNARAGDILVLSGTYNMGNTGVTTARNGTASSRITIRAGGGGATLVGGTSGNGIAINHDYWSVEGVTIRGFQKSLRIDSASHGILDRLTCSLSTGEAIKLRNSSQYWLVSNCTVFDTGAEGYYTGDADQNWEGGVIDRTGYVTFYNCVARNTANDGFDNKEGTLNIKIVNSSATWTTVVPGANSLGNSGIYNRTAGLQVINFSTSGNASLGNAIRSHRLLGDDGNYYGSGGEYLNVAASGLAGSMLYNTHLDGELFGYSMSNVAGGLLESNSQMPAMLDPGAFRELRWSGIGGGQYYFTAIPEPGAVMGALSALGGLLVRRR
jgi:hypothetical protein